MAFGFPQMQLNPFACAWYLGTAANAQRWGSDAIAVLPARADRIASHARGLPTLAMAGAKPDTLPQSHDQLLVPNAAGGLPDTVARIVGRRLQERLAQSVVIENRPGANGRVAVAALLSSPADGYTLVVTDGAILSINPLLSCQPLLQP